MTNATREALERNPKGAIMTDRELLELAAKAVGISGEYRTETLHDGVGWVDVTAIFLDNDEGWWNSLTDDGDRYRLLSKLKGRVDFERRVVTIGGTTIHWPDDEPTEARAIVRAAAELGKQGEQG